MSMVMDAYGTFEQARERIGWADRRVLAAYKLYQQGLRHLGPYPADLRARMTLLAREDALCAALQEYHATLVQVGAALRTEGWQRNARFRRPNSAPTP
jgi:hypothetical protein